MSSPIHFVLRERREKEEKLQRLGGGCESDDEDSDRTPQNRKETTSADAFLPSNDAGIEVERELARRMDLLDTAAEERRRYRKKASFAEEKLWQGGDGDKSVSNVEEESYDSGFDDDEDADHIDDFVPSAALVQSRYRTDFIELGLLGRGGGGEVVKVKNRLDRRTYAVKKIPLEAESGRFAKFGVAQNRKLRREVTTISRMTHKNIVRYYQAWVEGGEETGAEEKIGEGREPIANGGGLPQSHTEKSGDGSSENGGQIDNDSDTDDTDEGGWWKTSPVVGPVGGAGLGGLDAPERGFDLNTDESIEEEASSLEEEGKDSFSSSLSGQGIYLLSGPKRSSVTNYLEESLSPTVADCRSPTLRIAETAAQRTGVRLIMILTQMILTRGGGGKHRQ